MPSTSAKQARFMNIVAHSPKFAKQAGIPQKVGQDFHAADKASHKYGMAKGGVVKCRDGCAIRGRTRGKIT